MPTHRHRLLLSPPTRSAPVSQSLGCEMSSSESEEDHIIESSEDDDDEFEDQGSSDDEDNLLNPSDDEDDEEEKEEEELLQNTEKKSRSWSVGRQRSLELSKFNETPTGQLEKHLHIDDLSSDDEEGETNTIGRVPLHWYDAYDHIGYNISGQKIIKQKQNDSIDNAIANRDDPTSAHTVYDMYNDRYVTLSERDLEIIRRVQSGAFAHPEHNDTPDYVDYYSSIVEQMPIMAAPEPKRRFITSKWEMMKVTKIVKAIKEGRYVFLDEKLKQKKEKEAKAYMIWNDTEDEILADSKRNRFHLPAPKVPLPGHAESYNPPSEYLLSPEELEKQQELPPEEREYNFTPAKYSCLRHVPGYDNFVKERFERCLDLYLCPRKLKRRLNINPETLVPKLPKPKELKPYPNTLSLQYLGHTKNVRSITVSPDGQYLVSGSDDGTVRLWEVDTSLCREVWKFSDPVVQVTWNPNPQHHVVAVVTGNKIVLVATGTGDRDSNDVLDSFLSVVENGEIVEDDKEKDNDSDSDSDDSEKQKTKPSKKDKNEMKWQGIPSENENDSNQKKRDLSKKTYRTGPRAQLVFKEAVSSVVWHYRGDYIGAISPTAGAASISIHQVSKGSTQFPFRRKSPGTVEAIQFHPSRPYLFVVTQQHVKIYHLIEQKMVKKLLSGCKWLSSLDVHQSGDHVILGSYDRRVVWFDLDLASTPYKTLKFHEKAVRDVKYHRRYPLMASAADDGTIHVFHSTVYSDLLKNPLIVPLKVLRGHGVKGGIGIHSIAFHPRQPWIFSAGADGVINLYQDVF